MVKRFEIYFIDLNPTIGSEISKIRPCVIVSPNEMNNALNTVIIAPAYFYDKGIPMRINCKVDGKKGQIVLDYLRSIDKRRLKVKLTNLDKYTQYEIIEKLLNMFGSVQ